MSNKIEKQASRSCSSSSSDSGSSNGSGAEPQPDQESQYERVETNLRSEAQLELQREDETLMEQARHSLSLNGFESQANRFDKTKLEELFQSLENLFVNNMEARKSSTDDPSGYFEVEADLHSLIFEVKGVAACSEETIELFYQVGFAQMLMVVLEQHPNPDI